jgi:hypothetical protein
MGNELVVIIQQKLAIMTKGEIVPATTELAALEVSGVLPALFKYENDATAHEERGPIRDHAFTVFYGEEERTLWQFDLLGALEKVFFGRSCRPDNGTLPSYSRNVTIHARDLNSRIIAVAWDYLASEVIRRSELAQLGPMSPEMNTTEWLSNYREGMVAMIKQRLNQQFNDVKRVHGIIGANTAERAYSELDKYYATGTHRHVPNRLARGHENVEAKALGNQAGANVILEIPKMDNAKWTRK